VHTKHRVKPADGKRPAFSVGSLIADKYIVERTLGSGGLGVVVVARHLELEQRVAIKYLKDEVRTNPRVVERFRREALIAAQIRSQHVVKIQDVGEMEGAGPYIVMEYLEGQDLGRVAEDGSLSIPQSVDYILQACEALAEVHAAGIVHRDLKPENLFLAEGFTTKPILKIIDFGISKVTTMERRSGHRWQATSVNERLGTPLYMSPEQLRCVTDVDHRADIWALGVVLFELVTGTVPFDGADFIELSANILTQVPRRPSSVVAGLPGRLEAVILRCLEKDASRRFRSATELAERLAPFRLAAVKERRSPAPASGKATLNVWPPMAAPQRLSPALDARPLPEHPAHCVALPILSTVRVDRRVRANPRLGSFLPVSLGGALLTALALWVSSLRGAPDTPMNQPVAAFPVSPPATSAIEASGTERRDVAVEPVSTPPPSATPTATEPPPRVAPRASTGTRRPVPALPKSILDRTALYGDRR
jgi:serine/threonine protein kinase